MARNGRRDRRISHEFRRKLKYNLLPSQRRFQQCAARFKGFSGPVGTGKEDVRVVPGSAEDVQRESTEDRVNRSTDLPDVA